MQDLEALRTRLGGFVQRALQPLTAALQRFGVRSNHITVAGTLAAAAAAVSIVRGELVTAGVLFLLAGGLDMLDGALARSANRVTHFGAFLDSTFDRVSEGVVFAAIAFRFAQHDQYLDTLLVVLALLASLLVSYTRARAEALGVKCKVGVMTRAERVLVLAAGLFFDLLAYAVYVILAFSVFTVAQRMAHTYRSLRSERRLQ